MTNIQETLDSYLSNTKQYLYNAMNTPDLLERLQRRSYTVEKLAEGENLLNRTVELDQKKTQEYAESYAATDAINAAWDGLLDQFEDLRDLGRVACKNDRDGYNRMLLNQELSRSRSGLENQIRETLDNVLAKEELIGKLTPYGFDRIVLEGMKAVSDSLPALKQVRSEEKKEAQQATRDRDEALVMLSDYMSDFLAVARVATKDKPELMELLGVVVK